MGPTSKEPTPGRAGQEPPERRRRPAARRRPDARRRRTPRAGVQQPVGDGGCRRVDDEEHLLHPVGQGRLEQQRRPPRRASRPSSGRSIRAWKVSRPPKVSITTESAGSKPSSTGTAARTSSGVRKVRTRLSGCVGWSEWWSWTVTLPTTTDVAGVGAQAVENRPRGTLACAPQPDGRWRAVRCGRARPGLGPPPGPGRVLRRGRAARQAVPARQARRRGRHRRPRRGGHGVLRGAEVRRPLGDVDARGPLPVPARGVPHRPVPRLPRRQHRRDGAAARGLPAGGAPVPGRGVRRPRAGGPARPGGRDGDRARPSGSGRDVHEAPAA